MVRCDQTPVWDQLRRHFDASGRALDMRQAFAADPQRFDTLSQDAPWVFADLSKSLTDAATESLLLALAEACGLTAHRDAMFAGDCINTTEQRSVMHTLLRNPPLSTESAPNLAINGIARKLSQVHQTLDAMLAYADAVRADAHITDIVNIGIGGSDLGPQMAVLALEAFSDVGRRIHFVSNVDGQELAGVLARLKPESTLFLVASKTFTTTETLVNARSARAWYEAAGGTDIAGHFVALTSNVPAANAFGITTTFGFWDWVGGRYSMWSAIGLPIAIAVGSVAFRQFLAGAHAMDEHFRTAPLARNLPVRLGLLDLWYRNFHGFSSRSIAPYHSGLRRLPAYLQQLEMESNGKGVDREGRVLPYQTSPVLWGEPGTNGQHAYFQMIHQGTEVTPVEFIAVKKARHSLSGHQSKLVANALAQAKALMLGKDDGGEGAHKHFPGNRPSTFFVLDDLTPEALGAFIAMYEHRVFVSGALWGINNFDQWGVELGKVMAKDLEARLLNGDANGLDPSTAGLIERLKA